ncbi:universal stress protein [Candidatus Nitrosotalea bavarica]|uniref:universal stress protein n=1 Tax=Candidatus Nitrosotalea bavarica TaxID=1903277 RepID=UPI000C714892|nr:universal stress protein [Candidatus Nitrosotalea bavarica]
MGKSYNNILVPYDGSTYSQKALKMAFNMARAFDSALHLVNVIDVSTVSPPGQIRSKDTRKTLDQIKSTVKTSVESYLQKIQKEYVDSGVIVKGFVLEGDITGKLLKFIEDYNIDLVIIGSKGLSGVSKIMTLGSVSRKVSELAKCPVVIVR